METYRTDDDAEFGIGLEVSRKDILKANGLDHTPERRFSA